jgi:7-cyano-7-deazaguanine synthase
MARQGWNEGGRMKAVVLCSGGLDSVTLAHKLAAEAEIACLVTFDYGQRHRKELEFAGRCAARLGRPHRVIDLAAVGGQLTGSALTTDLAVPEGHYAEDTMRLTIVPNRNAILLSIAFGVAVAGGADAVAAAFHGGDHFIYPDCRPAFVESFAAMQRAALDGVAAIALHTPFLKTDKAGIVREGARLGVPFADTWSCYRGLDRHCGRCGTCVERREAFHGAGVADLTAYADPDYWRQAVADFAAKTRRAARAGE